MLEIPQPEATSIYYEVCGQIDQHNRKRQDDLDIEKTLVSHAWHIRVNISLFSISVVDSFNVYKACSGEDNKNQDSFYTLLSEELIDNAFDQTVAHRTRRSNDTTIPAAAGE